ncbi:hypothetical protein PHISCL_03495 [Aspergillus sclerotialis]|uniref:Altered inheritance of mitochondria protein 9, mitochondrial n=1 Tax=Aspergillus sclerotialis TaxID=2070753 RepID=A0A3A2ZMD7_9EURO|nr:hypothetical protein PHISCL_03495 [Aspergillus sclerotialis]
MKPLFPIPSFLLIRHLSKPTRLSKPQFHVKHPLTALPIRHHHSIPNPETIYAYTSGRWLVSEDLQLKQRYMTFDINKLCSLAVEECNKNKTNTNVQTKATKCINITKLEGASNKALVLTMDNGSELVAKIPCLNAGPKFWTTASEVATLMFLKKCTSIPVPDVYSWSSEAENRYAVGAEYILMSKADGVSLDEKWVDMTRAEKHKVIDRVIEIERELSNLIFPAYGNLYLRVDVPARWNSYPLSSKMDPEGLFCVGPSYSSIWLNEKLSGMKADEGPWKTFESFAANYPQREKARVAKSPDKIQSQLNTFHENQSVEELNSFIERITSTLPILCAHGPVKETSIPVLWHMDLNLNNIFVDSENPTKITSIIDWQSARIRPLFMQAHFPRFVEPRGWKFLPFPAMPALPDDFDSLSEEEKEKAKRTLSDAMISKYYELRTRATEENRKIFTALSFDRRLWEPFLYCQLFSHGSLVPNINTLIRLSEAWSELGLPGDCPYRLTEEELKRHYSRVDDYDARREIRETVFNALRTDESGWVENERFEAVKEMQKQLWEEFVRMVVEEGGEMGIEEARRVWPFPTPDDC